MVENEENFLDNNYYQKENQTYYEKKEKNKINKDEKIEKIDYYSDTKDNNEENQKNFSKKENNDEELEIEEILMNENFEDNDNLSQSIKNILLDKEFASSIIPQKENYLITDYHYVTFKNSYGENSCFVNVILHLIYNIDELYEYLISLYQIDESNNETKNKTFNDDKNRDINKFFALLGKILYKYDITIAEENDEGNKKKSRNNNQITILKTLDMRKLLAKISSNTFPLNTIADPVELFNYILEILNKNLEEDIHKGFHLELIDKFYCRSKNNCETTIENKYDKDNFFYHIYMDEILNYIDKNNLKVKDYKNKLFELSYKLFLSENIKKCEKCGEEMEHNLVCMNNPRYLLINCVWKESNPILDDVICLFFLMSLKDELNNLFICYNKKNRKKSSYYLFGFILYSFTLSHYIICTFNYKEDVFALYDDETVKEYKNLYELIIDITVNNLKINGKAFFYPVMLIFTQDKLYENKNIAYNLLKDSDYNYIINKCNEAIYEYQTQNEINEEDKLNNYQDYIQKQREIENNIKKKNKKRNQKEENEIGEKELKKKEINNNNIKKEINKNKEKKENKIISQEEVKKGINNINEKKLGNILKDINKIKGEKYKNDLYIGNFRELDKIIKNENNKKYSKNKENELEKENNEKKYKSVIIPELNVNENKEVYKKSSNLGGHNNIKITQKDEDNKDYQNNNKEENKNEYINDKKKYIYTNKNNKNSKENIDIDNKSKREKNMTKSINAWNNTFNLLNKDNNKINQSSKGNNEEINNKKDINDKEYIYNTIKNKPNFQTPKKPRFHYKPENNNIKNAPLNASEKKTHIYKSQFIANLNENNDDDKENLNSKKENKEYKNDNYYSNNAGSIRRKYYLRKNKPD